MSNKIKMTAKVMPDNNDVIEVKFTGDSEEEALDLWCAITHSIIMNTGMSMIALAHLYEEVQAENDDDEDYIEEVQCPYCECEF